VDTGHRQSYPRGVAATSDPVERSLITAFSTAPADDQVGNGANETASLARSLAAWLARGEQSHRTWRASRTRAVTIVIV